MQSSSEQQAFPTPDKQTPIVIVSPTYPAVFAVRPLGSPDALTTDASLKLKRPGVILLASMKGRNGDLRHPEEIQLRRPAPPLVRDVGRLKLDLDEDGISRIEISAVSGQKANDFQAVPFYPAYSPEEEEGDPFVEPSDGEIRLLRAPTSDSHLKLVVTPVVRLPGVYDYRAKRERKKPPPTPDPYGDTLPNELKGQDAIYPARAELEVWIALTHLRKAPGIEEEWQEDADKSLAHDVALFTIAPVLFSSEVDEPERLFMVRVDDQKDQEGNFGTVAEMIRLAGASNAACTLLLPSGGHDDVWVQDAALLGYCSTPKVCRHVAVACNRRKQTKGNHLPGLESQIKDYLQDGETGLFTDLPELCVKISNASNTRDYGGNLVVSPPVLERTEPHPLAPYGKLILGDSGSSGPRPSETYGAFLLAQRVQPVISIDTSWLQVGHADELVSFVRAPSRCQYTGCGGKGWAMLLAWPDLAVQLLQSVAVNAPKAVGGTHCGSEPLKDYQLTKNAAKPLDRNAHAWLASLEHTRDLLMAGLALEGKDIVLIPVLFSADRKNLTAVFPNMANHVGMGTRLAIPKPWGPRVPPKVAAEILKALPGAGITAEMVAAANLDTLQVDYRWLGPDAGDDFEKDLSALGRLYGADSVAMAELILKPGDRLPAPFRQATNGWDRVPQGWRVYKVNLDLLDIFEAYVAVRLKNLGLEPVFIDDMTWYHSEDGELHCGSKMRRKPHGIKAEHRWWRNWEEYLTMEAKWK